MFSPAGLLVNPGSLYTHAALCIFTPTPPPAFSPSAAGHPVVSCVATSSSRPVHQIGLLSNLQFHFDLFMTHATQTDALLGHTQSIPKMFSEGQGSGSNQRAQPTPLASAPVTLSDWLMPQ